MSAARDKAKTSQVFDWKIFEDQVFSLCEEAFGQLGETAPERPFYAAALYGVSREADGLISLPLLGANTTEAGGAVGEASFWEERWNPYDWVHQEIEVGARFQDAVALEKMLTDEATRGTWRHWERTLERYERVLVRITRRLRDRMPSLLPLTKDAVVFWHDEEGGPDLAARTIPKRLFDKHFAVEAQIATARKALAAQKPEIQAAFFVTRLGRYDGINSEMAQDGLVALGRAAVPALLLMVDEEKEGWLAAKLLGEIGDERPEVIEALRRLATDGGWPACALGMLEDYGWLAKQPADVGARGFSARYLALPVGSRTIELDYEPLETWLDRADESGVSKTRSALAPGRSYAAIAASDVHEALRGVRSNHTIVRIHACTVLGRRHLGATAGKRILPALARCLSDPDPTVRRIAILSIVRWKSAAERYRDTIVAMQQDPDEMVREAATRAFG